MTLLRKTIARRSSRSPEQIPTSVTVKVQSRDLSRLRGLAALRGCSVQEVVRGFIEKGLGQ